MYDPEEFPRVRFEKEISRVPLLSDLSPYERASLSKHATRLAFPAGSVIIAEVRRCRLNTSA